MRETEQAFEPRWNYYRCLTCHLCFVTVDVQDGVTPMFLKCRNPRGCEGRMASGMYASPDMWPVIIRGRAPDGVWVRPTKKEARQMKRQYPALYKHVKDGGLILRRPQRGDPAPPKVAAVSELE